MDASLIDITSQSFWLVVAAASLILAPVQQADLRRFLLACVNIAFLWVVLDGGVWAVLGAVLGLHALVRILVSRRALRQRDRAGHSVARTLAAGGDPRVRSTSETSTLPLTRGCLNRRTPMALLFFLLASLTTLFLLHKVPSLDGAWRLPEVNPLLAAIGFSYVFLRAIDLLRDVWETGERPDLISVVNYLLPFHMLPAGPIQSYQDFKHAPVVPQRPDDPAVLAAMERIVRGLFKKFVLAYVLRQLFLADFQSNGWLWFLELQVFFLWLYLDFSAYSDIAVGVGRLIGVATPENFNRPYVARNLVEFWERWHITLSDFIKRNIFIPIQMRLMRQRRWSPLLCANVAVSVSFVLCGLWHGIGVRFLVWGLVHCGGLMCVNTYRQMLSRHVGKKRLKAYMGDWRVRVVSTIATYEFVALSLLPLFWRD